MSRNFKRKRNKHSEKRCGRNKIDADAPRRSTKRKRCRSNKKRLCKLKRIKFHCTICVNTTHGVKRFLDCGHVFHKKCINQWLKNPTGNCPNCRKDIPTNTGGHQRSNPESRSDSSANPSSSIHRIWEEDLQTRELILSIQNRLMNMDNLSIDLDVPSLNLDNSNMDIPANTGRYQRSNPDIRLESSAHPRPVFRFRRPLFRDFRELLRPIQDLDDPRIDLDVPSPNLHNPTMPSDDRSADTDNSNIDLDDQSSDMDSSSTDSPDISSNLDIPARELPHRSRNLDNPREEVPVLFVPVYCCRCKHDSNAQSEQEGFDSNEINGSRRVLWHSEEVRRQISTLRNRLEGRDFTLNVLNSSAEPDRFNAEPPSALY